MPETKNTNESEQIIKEKKPKSPIELKHWVYIERESQFSVPRSIKLDNDTHIAKFGEIQRATGVIEGTLINWCDEKKTGEIEIEGNNFLCQHVMSQWNKKKKIDWKKHIGQSIQFSFWPTTEKISNKSPDELTKLTCLKLATARPDKTFNPGYVEVVGKLEQIFSGYFIISIWSKQIQQYIYIIFAGEYPYPDEAGEFVWVIGQFDAKSGTIRLKEADTLAFLPKKEAIAISNKLKEEYKSSINKEAKANEEKKINS